MGILYILVLSALPGSWLTFGLPLDELSWRVRLALGVAMSPAVLGIQLLIIKLFGIDFAWAAPILVVANLPSILLMIRRLSTPQLPYFSKPLVLGGLLFVLLAGTIILPWLLIPNYRAFSWHGLLHTDIVYQLTRRTLLPEEPELAGLSLSYAWIGHTYWAVTGWMSDRPPIYIYPLSNLIWLLTTFVLAYDVSRAGLRLRQSTALLSVGLTFLGTHIIGLSIRLMANDGLLWRYWMGFRFGPILGKFRGFEVMPFAFALLVGLTLVCLLGVQRRIRLLWAITACLQIALGLIYPILLPISYILVGILILLLAGQLGNGLARYDRKDILLLIITQAISVAVIVGYLALITQNQTDSAFQLAQSGRKIKILHVVISLFPFLLASLPFLIVSFRRRAAAPALLLVTGACSMGLYILTSLGENEYKYILGATIMLAPLSAAGLDRIFHRFEKGCSRGRWIPATALFLVLISINLLYFFRLGVNIPRSLANAPGVNESSFWIALSPNEEDAAWTQAIRNYTPNDTVLVAQASHLHLGPFVARSLYMPSDLNGEMSSGYSLPNQLYLLEQRGYSAAVYQRRLEIIQILFSESNPDRLIIALGALQDLNRPLVIHFSDQSTPALDWLARQGIGSVLFADEGNVVWFIDRGEQSNGQSNLPIR